MPPSGRSRRSTSPRKRAEQLFAKNFAPKSQLEQATLSYDQAVATRDAARSTLAQAQNQVGYTELKAERERHRHRRQRRCRPGGRRRHAGVTVAVDGEKEVLIAVPEMDIAAIQAGQGRSRRASGPTTR